jgi:hypothetical protein
LVADESAVERTALKEWAVLVHAMMRGELVAMVRKGGIREQRAGFSVRHDRFLLYPTYFHEKVNELAPRYAASLETSHAHKPEPGTIRIECVADVLGMWQVKELETLRAIEGEHGMSWGAVESRFHYKNKPGVQVIAVRVSKLEQPVVVAETRRYLGCVSWVELDDNIDVSNATPVLDDASLMMRVARLRNALGT